jgi:hypothetical protein
MENERKYLKIHEDKYQKARVLVTAIKARYWSSLSSDRNVVGAAFGRRIVQNETTDDPALVVYVMRKVAKRFIPSSRLLPRRWHVGGDCVEVDVVETGPIYPLAFTARERPATAGISIGNANEASAGTLGAVVIDNSDNSACILSNNHVMARQNAAALGEAIVQPGVFDAGVSPADNIALLKRFVVINMTGNTVDGAIAQIIGGVGRNVIDQVHNNIIPTAGAGHPAVGLLFAGGCNRMIMNSIANVLNQLNISLPGGAGAIGAADIGMNVEKVGRTTEYTTSSVKEIDATVNIDYDFGTATFDHQITTAWMSDHGDSGSLVYEGGTGGDEDKCGCGTTDAAATLLGVDLKQDQHMAEVVRDKFLRQTRLGRWGVDLFVLNEERLLERFHQTKIDPDDKNLARKFYDKYIEDARRAFVEGEKSEQRLTEHHLRDARTALKHARKYLHKDEWEAAEKLFALASENAKGKNAREILALLNNDKLFEEVKSIVSKVKGVKTSVEPCD